MTIILSNLNRFKILKIGSDLTDPDKIRCFSRLSLLPQAKFCHNLQRGVGTEFLGTLRILSKYQYSHSFFAHLWQQKKLIQPKFSLEAYTKGLFQCAVFGPSGLP